MASVYVTFEASIRLYDTDAPALISRETIAQAVQDVIGHTGATVSDVLDYEDDGID